jgi:hypothetical protein
MVFLLPDWGMGENADTSKYAPASGRAVLDTTRRHETSGNPRRDDDTDEISLFPLNCQVSTFKKYNFIVYLGMTFLTLM